MASLMAAPSATISLAVVRGKQLISSSRFSFTSHDSVAKVGRFGVRASCFFNPQEPILKEAFKEPVAFVGGIFAGLLRLELTEEPLKEWVARTVEASGISEEEISKNGVEEEEEEMPQQIDIE